MVKHTRKSLLFGFDWHFREISEFDFMLNFLSFDAMGSQKEIKALLRVPIAFLTASESVKREKNAIQKSEIGL